MGKKNSISWKNKYQSLESKYQQVVRPAIQIHDENNRLKKEIEELERQLKYSQNTDVKDLVSLVMWSQRRMPKVYQEYVQAELEKNETALTWLKK